MLTQVMADDQEPKAEHLEIKEEPLTQVKADDQEPKAEHFEIKEEPLTQATKDDQEPKADHFEIKEGPLTQVTADDQEPKAKQFEIKEEPLTQVTEDDQEPKAEQFEIKEEPLTQVTEDDQESKPKHFEIKEEHKDSDCDIIEVKQETRCTSVEKHIKDVDRQLEKLINIDLEISFKRRDKSKVSHTKTSTKCYSLEKHVINKNMPLEASLEVASKIPINLPEVSIIDKAVSKNKDTQQKLVAINEGLCKILPLQEGNISDYEPIANTDHYSIMLRDITKSLTSYKSAIIRDNTSLLSPKTSVNSIIDNTGGTESLTRSNSAGFRDNSSMFSPKTSANSIIDNTDRKQSTSKISVNSIKDNTVKSKCQKKNAKKKKRRQLKRLSKKYDEDQPEIIFFQKSNTSGNKPLDISNHYSTKISDTTKFLSRPKSSDMSMLSPKTLTHSFVKPLMYSILDSIGRKQNTSSSEEARNILDQCGMPIKFASSTTCYKDMKECLIYVVTSKDGPIPISTLCIWPLKDEKRAFRIPFTNIREISQYDMNVMVFCYSTLTGCFEPIFLSPQATESREKKTNIAATISWLQTFLG